MLKGPSRGLKIWNMKKTLQFASGIVLLVSQVFTSNGQTIILAEDFSGFTTGTHSQPSTNDVSLALDTRTAVAGWRGNLIYSAGGEIKVGTASLTGWIETPEVDLSLAEGSYKIAFDIARWPGDASTVQVYLDGNAAGGIITPTDSYERKEVVLPATSTACRIKIQALTKRFFIDNLMLTNENVPTSTGDIKDGESVLKVWPIPAGSELNIANSDVYDELVICDISGRIRQKISVNRANQLKIDIGNFEQGVYLFTFISGKTRKPVKVIKQ
jgi:hypothetical protein